MALSSLWQRFQRYLLEHRQRGFSLDISRMKFTDDLFEKMRPQIGHAFAAMRELEAGAIGNPTEKRMVGHYWLEDPALAPTAQIRCEIEDTIRRIKAFAEDAHTEKITAENGRRFKLRDGVLNFFVTFVEVRNDRRDGRFDVEDGITTGDYLEEFLRGTRSALYENGRNQLL
jgi:glucose-6-phosphate isomerase